MSALSTNTAPARRIRVWDLGVRLFHWSLVAMVALTYATEARAPHRTMGYVVIGLIGFRLIWGFIGTRHARFVDFVPGPRGFVRYVKDMLRGREQRYVGHNPAGAAMILALLSCLLAVGSTGYMMGMNAYFGVPWVEVAHKALVNLLIVMVLLHVSGVVYSSLRHRENLVASMITGEKAVDQP